MEVQEQPEGSDEKTVLTVEGLNKTFGDNHVLNDLDLELLNGENLVVIGKSGSGKSVLIKCIVGLIKPDSGKINVLGKDVLLLKKEELDQLRREIGFLFQSDALYDSMTVRENLLFPLRTDKEQKEKEEADALVMEALKNVGLEKTVDMMPAELSGGMKKRISLARTLILKPKIILYDEPTTGLDSITGHEISELMLEVQEKYKTSSLIISHDLSCVRTVADRVAVLIDGKCRAVAPYKELLKSDDPDVKQFFEQES